MKTTHILLFLMAAMIALSSDAASALEDVTGRTRWELPQMDLELSLPGDLPVVTRTEVAHGPILEEMGLDPDTLLSEPSEVFVQLWALDLEMDCIIVVNMAEHEASRRFWNYNDLSDSKLRAYGGALNKNAAEIFQSDEFAEKAASIGNAEIAEQFKNNGIIVSFDDIYKTESATYMRLSTEETVDGETMFGRQYATAYNGRAITVKLLALEGPVTPVQDEILKLILESVTFTQTLPQPQEYKKSAGLSTTGQWINGLVPVILVLIIVWSRRKRQKDNFPN